MPQATNKFYIGIRNEASTKTLELYFTDYIYNNWDWNTYEEKNMVQDTINQIKAANPSKIRVIINSLGGDVMIGLAIYNYLKASGISVETENIGFAASIASVMLMAGGTRKMARNSFVIIHAASSGTWGNAKDLRSAADALDTVSHQLADVYAQTSGKHDAKYFTDRWADGDVWLTSEECLEMGLVTEITGEVAATAAVDIASYGFKNVPAALIQANASGEQTFFQKLENKMGKFLDKLTASITGARESKEPVALATKEDVLAFVEATLKPFAEALDAKEPALEAAGEPPVETPVAATEEAPAADVETPAAPTAAAEAPAQDSTLTEVLAELKALKEQMANAAARPTPAGKTEEKVLAGISFETE